MSGPTPWFGTFWAVEGLGVFEGGGSAHLDWPGGDAMILGVLAAWIALSWISIRVLTPHATSGLRPPPVAHEEAAS